MGVEDEKRRESREEKKKKKVAHLPSAHEEVFSEARLFLSCFSDVGGRGRHAARVQSLAALHHLCVVLLSIDSVLRCSHRAFTRIISCISRLESPGATIPPIQKKTPYFEDFKRALRGNTLLRGPAAYSQMNYGARLQLKDLNPMRRTVLASAERLLRLEVEDYRSWEGEKSK